MRWCVSKGRDGQTRPWHVCLCVWGVQVQKGSQGQGVHRLGSLAPHPRNPPPSYQANTDACASSTLPHRSLCEHLLFRRGPGMGPPVGHQPSPAQEQWSLEKNLLLKYTSILCGGVTRSQAALERRLQRLEDGARAREGSPGGGAELAAPAGASPLAQQVDRCLHTPWLRAAAAAAVVVLPQGDAWLARGARSACIVLLATSPQPRVSKSLGTRCRDDT